MAYEEYMREIVKPMRAELANEGFKELTTKEEVHAFMEEAEGTALIVVNSVCGCAAGLARPAAINAVKGSPQKPDRLATVFAGQDKEATAEMRAFFKGYEASSPSMALLRNKEVVHFIPREEIEDHEVEDIIANLQKAFEQYC